jgi:hypothetical protein
MAGDTLEFHVTASDLDIRITDAGSQDIDESFISFWHWSIYIGEGKFVVKHECFHDEMLPFIHRACKGGSWFH